MKYADYVCAWIILGVGIARILIIEMWHPPSAVLDTPLLWILLAMLNLLRLGNGYQVKGLRVFCIGANVSVSALEAVRFKMFGASALIAAVPILAETLFSIIRSTRPKIISHPESHAGSSIGLSGACMKLHVRYTFDDYREANRLHRVGSFWTRWSSRASLLAGGLLIIAGFMIFFFVPHEAWRGLFPFGCGVLLVFSWTLLPVLMQRQEFAKNSYFQHDSSFDISEGSIRYDSPIAHSEHQWNSIIRWLENDTMFLVYTSPRLFMMLPKRTFGPTEANEFRQLLLRKLPANSGS